jgi:predicted dinucleotide-binding enzyme
MLPYSKVIKAFNIVGNVHMIHPDFPGGPPTMFICGNDEDAKKTLTDNILTKFGWEKTEIVTYNAGKRTLIFLITADDNHMYLNNT